MPYTLHHSLYARTFFYCNLSHSKWCCRRKTLKDCPTPKPWILKIDQFNQQEEDITAAKPKKARNPMSLDKSRKSIRQSMEYARQFAFVSSSTRSGTLTIWDRYLRAATALATAESEGRMVS